MSFETMFNQNTREAFKKSIDYPMQAARRLPEKTVLLDWRGALQKVTDAEGTVWTSNQDAPALGQMGEGRLRANLQSPKGAAIVDIIALSGDWKERLDYLIWAESLTHRGDVNLKVLPGIDDLYLVPKDSPEIPFVSFLYGNFYIKITHWDGADVDALAKAIYQLMKGNSQIDAAKNRTCFKIAADKAQLAIGETVTIKIEGVAQNWNSQWIYNQPQQLLGDEVEYVEQKDNLFVFKALKKGKVKIPFAAMHTQTMYVELQSVELEIN